MSPGLAGCFGLLVDACWLMLVAVELRLEMDLESRLQQQIRVGLDVAILPCFWGSR